MATTTYATVEPALQLAASNYIGGRFVDVSGNSLISGDPAYPERVLWEGSPRAEHIEEAVAAARKTFPQWAALTIDQRADYLKRWAKITSENVARMAGLITDEMGKTLFESTQEAKALAEKVNITLDDISMDRVRGYEVRVGETRAGLCRFKPHGVMAVIGPYNFPAHLANGHFVPALLMGNAVIVKPSEKTPAVGQLLAELMHEIGLPPGVFNVVQGGGDIAARLLNHDDIDGVLFTGSWQVGRKILQANLDRPGRIIALEMGGNNPSVVMDDAHFKQAVIENVRSAFATTGQRCTCTRRIIVQRGIADRFIHAFCKSTSMLLIGPGRSQTPVFMGPLINHQSVENVLGFQRDLVHAGGRILVQATSMETPGGGHFVSPGVVEVDRFTIEQDCEVFGPFAQISIVNTLDDAIEQANATQYGLAASIFTSNVKSFERFFNECRSGCINWNTGTAGASGKLPFGGVGHSGNYRPAGAFSVDYCAYPIANMIEESDEVSIPTGMHWSETWR